ncbi:hypothetical protein [Caballeronia sp. 15711]|uniref:hypothetical protein n=1 Tax=Caballeronia sp. 15711 TaxID=3391029 RepID=UPI0039E50598
MLARLDQLPQLRAQLRNRHLSPLLKRLLPLISEAVTDMMVPISATNKKNAVRSIPAPVIDRNLKLLFWQFFLPLGFTTPKDRNFLLRNNLQVATIASDVSKMNQNTV